MSVAIARLIARLPLPLLHAAGSLLGWIAYLASPAYRRKLDTNLAQAGYAGWRVRCAAIASAGRLAAETPAIWLRPRADVVRWVRHIDGEHLIEAARAQGRAIVFITLHQGCFEITARAAAERFPITVLYRPPKFASLQRLIEAGRAQANLALAPATTQGVRQLLAAVRRAESVGILPDQVPGEGEGEWAEFFGRPAYTMTLAMRLAERADVAPILAFGERLAWGRGYVIHLRELPPSLEGETSARRLNRALEAMIRECPGQYLWGYNRYKAPARRDRAPPPAD